MISNNVKQLFSTLCKNVGFDEPMHKHTTFQIGGPADCLAFPSNEAEVIGLLRAAKENDVPVTMLGNCSNVLVLDGGIPGLTILINSGLTRTYIDGNIISAEAGISMSSLAQVCMRAGLSGFEFASGIPGCLGGGIFMNAGAYNGEVGSLVRSVRILNENLIPQELTSAEMCFSYRHTALSGRRVVVLSATLELTPDSPDAIAMRITDYTRRRRDRQPLNYPSAGSVFKRPEGAYAAALIDEAGLKGLSVGGAQVSTKHAGFFVNTGNATAADVLALIEEVKQRVFENSGFTLEPEVRMVGKQLVGTT